MICKTRRLSGKAPSGGCQRAKSAAERSKMAVLSPRLRRVLCAVLLGLCAVTVGLVVVLLARTYSLKPAVPAPGIWARKGERRVEAAFSPQERRDLKEALKGNKSGWEWKGASLQRRRQTETRTTASGQFCAGARLA